ncbi:transcription-repair-coupling factor-like protein, partial [Chrysochromulina tobinii]
MHEEDEEDKAASAEEAALCCARHLGRERVVAQSEEASLVPLMSPLPLPPLPALREDEVMLEHTEELPDMGGQSDALEMLEMPSPAPGPPLSPVVLVALTSRDLATGRADGGSKAGSPALAHGLMRSLGDSLKTLPSSLGSATLVYACLPLPPDEAGAGLVVLEDEEAPERVARTEAQMGKHRAHCVGSPFVSAQLPIWTLPTAMPVESVGNEARAALPLGQLVTLATAVQVEVQRRQHTDETVAALQAAQAARDTAEHAGLAAEARARAQALRQSERNLLAPAAHDEGVVTHMDVDTGIGAGASDEPVAANDPEFDEEDDEAMMRNSVEAHVKTAATRLSLIRAPCPPYAVQMGSLAARFGHVLTADQERAIADVTADMTAKDHPMDRLVCGDVGFGKTEVAVRAIYLAACAGRQSALLVPSIVVAGLHADALRARLPTEVCIEVLTRKTKHETLLHRVAAGVVSVVVGTSALLSPALTFKNLGLLVVDEEQRFGVAQKEVWKTRAPSIDVLTLTATPIP